jgi:hypothetical protein
VIAKQTNDQSISCHTQPATQKFYSFPYLYILPKLVQQIHDYSIMHDQTTVWINYLYQSDGIISYLIVFALGISKKDQYTRNQIAINYHIRSGQDFLMHLFADS